MNNSVTDAIIILYLCFIVTIYNDLVLMHRDLMSKSQAVESYHLVGIQSIPYYVLLSPLYFCLCFCRIGLLGAFLSQYWFLYSNE